MDAYGGLAISVGIFYIRKLSTGTFSHTNTDITKIPDAWLAQAKLLTIHYAHTSHGSQILSGLTWLEGQNSNLIF